MVIQQYLTYVIDILFPPRPDELRVRSLTAHHVETLYGETRVDACISLSSYTHPSIRTLIHEAKFYNNARACTLLGRLIKQYCTLHCTNIPTVLIPIPLSKKRMRTRGYNQVTRILHTVDLSPFPLVIDSDTLIRIRHTRPQTELARDERLRNVTDAFRIKNPKRVQDKHIVLIDDVTTTGATLTAAKATLLPHHPASITCIALAH